MKRSLQLQQHQHRLYCCSCTTVVPRSHHTIQRPRLQLQPRHDCSNEIITYNTAYNRIVSLIYCRQFNNRGFSAIKRMTTAATVHWQQKQHQRRFSPTSSTLGVRNRKSSSGNNSNNINDADTLLARMQPIVLSIYNKNGEQKQLAVSSYYESLGDYSIDEQVLLEYKKMKGLDMIASNITAPDNNNNTLPSLPLPSVEDTIELLKGSVQPFLAGRSNDIETSNFTNILQQSKSIFHQIYQPQLQHVQQESSKKQSSWLQFWWNTYCYLNIRTSNVIHSSYFFRFPPSSSSSTIDLSTSSTGNPIRRSTSRTTLEKATILLYGAIQYSAPIVHGSGIPNTVTTTTVATATTNKSRQLCPAQYKYMFGACRIPGRNCDMYRLYQYGTETSVSSLSSTNLTREQRDKIGSPHIVVCCKGQFYILTIDYDTSRDAASMMRHIHEQLIAIVNDRPSGTPDMGWLTTQNRNDWYIDYKWLIEKQSTINTPFMMQNAIHIIQSGLLLLCLDDDLNVEEINEQRNIITASTGTSAEADHDFASRLFHGGRSNSVVSKRQHHMGGNRWYDKSIQLIMTLDNGIDSTDTSFGIVGEHSMADGMPVAEFARYIHKCEHHFPDDVTSFFHSMDVKNQQLNDDHHDTSTSTHPTHVGKVHNIFQEAYLAMSEIDQRHLKACVNEARRKHIATTTQYALLLLDTSDIRTNPSIRSCFGSQFIKSLKISPDACIQMILQLASYRYFQGRTVGTYESTHTRNFYHGRTETIRTVSKESQEFCTEYTNSLSPPTMQTSSDTSRKATTSIRDLDRSERERILNLFRIACHTHSTYTKLASNGLGCDRHLFGLEILVNQEREKRAASSLAGNSTTTTEDCEITIPTKLFTNPIYKSSKNWTLSTSTLPGTMPGFGPVVDDGFGIGYDIYEHHVVYTLTCLEERNKVHNFRNEIERSMMDIYELLLLSQHNTSNV